MMVTKMKLKNSPRNGLKISICILIIILIILFIINIIPDESEILKYGFKVKNNDKIPIWKIIGYIIIGILSIIEVIVDLVMCRCKYCKKHIKYMDIFMNYCPYCSKGFND